VSVISRKKCTLTDSNHSVVFYRVCYVDESGRVLGLGGERDGTPWDRGKLGHIDSRTRKRWSQNVTTVLRSASHVTDVVPFMGNIGNRSFERRLDPYYSNRTKATVKTQVLRL
jgi:hypothetical protein